MPLPSPPPPLPATSEVQPKPWPVLSNHAWTTAEHAFTAALLQKHVTALDLADSETGICGVFEKGRELRFEEWAGNELLGKTQPLQLAITKLKSADLARLKRDYFGQGKGCMVMPIQAHDWTATGGSRKMFYFAKTAGDMLQTYWVHRHLLDSRYHFGFNLCQAAFARWICMPRCVFGEDATWNTHGLADLCETLTLYLPVRLARLYLSCIANFHKLVWSHMDVPRCQHVGRVPCHKATVDGLRLCHKHCRWRGIVA